METKDIAPDIAPDIDHLMEEADTLIHRINANSLEALEETRRIEFERHVRRLESIKSEVKGKADEKAASEGGPYGEGIHEAIVDIVKAMKNMAGSLS
jgi:enoyl-CoA hydratase/carnithine racemase